jgi:hypothetical protein
MGSSYALLPRRNILPAALISAINVRADTPPVNLELMRPEQKKGADR